MRPLYQRGRPLGQTAKIVEGFLNLDQGEASLLTDRGTAVLPTLTSTTLLRIAGHGMLLQGIEQGDPRYAQQWWVYFTNQADPISQAETP